MTSSSQRRLMWAWALAALLVSFALCFVPLFDLVGYELALAIAPLVAVAAIHLGLRTVASRRDAMSRAARDAAEVEPLGTVVAIWLRTLARTVPVLLVPLLVLGSTASG